MTNDFHRTQINLHAADAEWLQRHFGRGWTEKVREWIHRMVQDQKAWTPEFRPSSVDDFATGADDADE